MAAGGQAVLGGWAAGGRPVLAPSLRIEPERPQRVCMYACMYVCILIDGGCKCFVMSNTGKYCFFFSEADITALQATAPAAPHVNMHSRLQHPARRRRDFFQYIPTYMHAVGVFPDWSISIRNLSRLHLYNISLKKTGGRYKHEFVFFNFETCMYIFSFHLPINVRRVLRVFLVMAPMTTRYMFNL
jgi:hypothetical protein